MRTSLLTAFAMAAALLLAGSPAAAQAPQLDSLPAASGEAMAHTCAACHGTQGRLGDEAFMPLAGMPPAQFVQSMQNFRSGQRPATLMGLVARGFTDADLRAMAEYFARQTPAAGSAAAMVTPPKPVTPPANQGAQR